MIKIHETVKEDGVLTATFLLIEDGVPSIKLDDVEGGGVHALPDGAIEAVMKRYAAPLDPSEELIPVATLDLGGGSTLRHVRHLARYDVIARDYLVYETAGEEEATCALAITVAGALRYLALERP